MVHWVNLNKHKRSVIVFIEKARLLAALVGLMAGK